MTINGQVDGTLVALTPLRGSAPLLGGSPLPPPTVPTARPMDTPSDELVAWLAVAASALPSEPAVVAERFLIAADDARLGEALLARARALAGDAKLAAPGLVEAAVALYLRALRAMLLVEEARLGGVGFAAALLRAEPFHAALLACAAECVARAHGLGEAAGLGPLLDARKVSPYDLLKGARETPAPGARRPTPRCAPPRAC
jgi:GNAT superfamily N-acetyltransferase